MRIVIVFFVVLLAVQSSDAGFTDLFSRKPVFVNGTWKPETRDCDGKDSKGSYIDENSGKMRNAFCDSTTIEGVVVLKKDPNQSSSEGDYTQKNTTYFDLYDSSTGHKLTNLTVQEEEINFSKNVPSSTEYQDDLTKEEEKFTNLTAECEKKSNERKKNKKGIDDSIEKECQHRLNLSELQIRLSKSNYQLNLLNLASAKNKYAESLKK